MVNPKALLVLGVLMAALLIIPSEVAAAETAETASKEEQTKTSGDPTGYRCRYGCCWWYHGHCRRCCKTATEVPHAAAPQEDAVEEDQSGGRCHHGCCRWSHGRCIRCFPRNK